MFPTRLKAKIPSTSSYPLTAEEISEALANTPQAALLSIEFHEGWKSRLGSHNPYHSRMISLPRTQPRTQLPVLEVAFGWVNNEGPGAELAFQRGWLITVLPVPRVLRHKIDGLVQQLAFPAFNKWLTERKNLSLASSHGMQSLSALYDSKEETIHLQHYQSPGETFQTH